MTEAMVLVNGIPGRLHDPMISVTDMGFLHGDSVFTTMAVHEGRVVFWKEHVERLKSSATFFGYPSFPDPGLLERECRRILSLQPESPSVLRLTLSRGRAASPGIDSPSTEVTRVFLPIFRPPPPDSFYGQGVSVEPYVLPWPPSGDPRFRHKTGNLLWVKLIRSEKRYPESFEMLLVNGRDEILEGTVTSVFSVDGSGALRTAPVPSGILPGIMRARVLDWARETRRQVVEQALSMAEIFSCRQIFLASSTLPVLPVHTVMSPSGAVRLPRDFSVSLEFLDHYRRGLSRSLW